LGLKTVILTEEEEENSLCTTTLQAQARFSCFLAWWRQTFAFHLRFHQDHCHQKDIHPLKLWDISI
jgi:hypothetical protein